ncbi:MAG: hypothetical protein PHR30_08350 [Gallionellaceae bacterium]|nr:hypothetical protein [Gallionellaceae bacterium]
MHPEQGIGHETSHFHRLAAGPSAMQQHHSGQFSNRLFVYALPCSIVPSLASWPETRKES